MDYHPAKECAQYYAQQFRYLSDKFQSFSGVEIDRMIAQFKQSEQLRKQNMSGQIDAGEPLI